MNGNDRAVSYRVLQAWARLAVAVFYRRTDVTGRHHLDPRRPAVLAANHASALGDVAVIVATMPRFPHFLASASWWKSPPARLLFRLGGVLPIHRRRDSDTGNNVSTFEACDDALAHGAHLCIFPEGEMHDEPALLPLKTGAARIALGAGCDAGVPGVVVVPVGLVYEDRGRFRSDTEVHFGEPIAVEDWAGAYRADPAKAVRDLTDVLADRLADVTVNHGSPAEASTLANAAATALADTPDASLPRRNAMRRALARGVALTGGEDGEQFRALESAVGEHRADLDAIGLGHRGCTVPIVGEDARLVAQRRVELFVLAVPAALGALVNAPIAAGAGLAATRVRDDGWRATVKGVTGTFLAPLVWGGEYALLARRVPRRWAFAFTAAGALSGRAALAWHDRWREHRVSASVRRAIATRPGDVLRARESRARVRALVDQTAS